MASRHRAGAQRQKEEEEERRDAGGGGTLLVPHLGGPGPEQTDPPQLHHLSSVSYGKDKLP